MNAFLGIEDTANSNPAGVGVGVEIGNVWVTDRIGEADPDWGAGGDEMWSAGESASDGSGDGGSG